MKQKNIFVAGAMATGQSFIGRKSTLVDLAYYFNQGDICAPKISINGMNKIGKTSLVHALLERLKAQNDSLVTIQITISEYHNFFEFWEAIVEDIHRKLKVLASQTISSETTLYEAFIKSSVGRYSEFISSIKRYFAYVSQSNDIIISIDEFDAAPSVFEGKFQYFQFLRGIVSEANYRFAFILISRRTINHIEKDLEKSSNLALVFEPYNLKGFNKEDLEEYFETLFQHGVELNYVQKARILFYTGRLPFLLSIFGYRILADFENHNIDLIAEKEMYRIDNYFDGVIDLLKHEKLLDILLQTHFGPRYDLRQSDIKILKELNYLIDEKPNYGIASVLPIAENQIERETLSRYFMDRLAFLAFEIHEDSQKLLFVLERQLRSIIKQQLEIIYGESWEEKLKTHKAKLINATRAEQFRTVAHDRHGKLASDCILHYVAIGDLLNIIKQHWGQGMNAYFGGRQLRDFDYKFNRIAIARDPWNHANPEFLTPEEVEECDLFCKEIIKIIGQNTKEF